MASRTFGVKWIDVEIEGEISGVDGKEKIQLTDENGEPQFKPIPKIGPDGRQLEDGDGNPLWDEPGEPIMIEVPKRVTHKVVFLVDIPPKVEATRIQRAAHSISAITHQQQISVVSMTTTQQMGLSMLRDQSMSLAREIEELPLVHKKTLPDGSVVVDHETVRKEQVRIYNEIRKLNFMQSDLVEQHYEREEYSRKAEKIMFESVDMIIGYVKDVRRKAREDDLEGPSMLFHCRSFSEVNGERVEDVSLKTWPEMTPLQRRDVVQRIIHDFVPPVMAALSRGASVVTMEK